MEFIKCRSECLLDKLNLSQWDKFIPKQGLPDRNIDWADYLKFWKLKSTEKPNIFAFFFTWENVQTSEFFVLIKKYARNFMTVFVTLSFPIV